MKDQKSVTKKQVEGYLKYFNVNQEKLFTNEHTEKRRDWIKSVFARFTDFGYVKDAGLLIRVEQINARIIHSHFDNLIKVQKIKNMDALVTKINSLIEIQNNIKRERLGKMDDVMESLSEEKRMYFEQTIKLGKQEMAKIQSIASGKLNIHISDFKIETIEKIKDYCEVQKEINQKINRSIELKNLKDKEGEDQKQEHKR